LGIVTNHYCLCWVLTVPLVLVGCDKHRLDERAKELCAKDGGVTVHEVVKLPAEKFDQWGNVRIPAKSDAAPSDDYYYVRETTYLKTGNPEMWRSHHQVIRRFDGKVLGESISYSRRGGDMPGPWHDSSFGCPDMATQPSLERSIFIRKDGR